jgi:hypothetical protein
MPDPDERRALGEFVMALMRQKGIVAGPVAEPEALPEPPKRTGVHNGNPVPEINPEKPTR